MRLWKVSRNQTLSPVSHRYFTSIQTAEAFYQTLPDFHEEYKVYEASWEEREHWFLHYDGGYQKPCWYNDLEPIDKHYAHVSHDDPQMIAFTPSAEYGERGRYTKMKPGKYLAKFYPGLTSIQVEYYSAWWMRGTRPVLPGLGEVKFAKTPKEVAQVYEKGPTSCMQHYPEAVGCYAAGDLELAYLVRHDDAKIIARALTWPEKKIYGRVYPNVESWKEDGFPTRTASGAARDFLAKALDDMGWKEAFESGRGSPWNGARLLKKKCSRGGYHMPYLDHGPYVMDRGDHWVITDGAYRGNEQIYGATSTSAYISGPPAPVTCEVCGESCQTRGGHYHVRHNYGGVQHSWCQTCTVRDAYRCEGSGDWIKRTTSPPVSVWDRYGTEQTWCEGYANHYALKSDKTGNLFQKDDAVKVWRPGGTYEMWGLTEGRLRNKGNPSGGTCYVERGDMAAFNEWYDAQYQAKKDKNSYQARKAQAEAEGRRLHSWRDVAHPTKECRHCGLLKRPYYTAAGQRTVYRYPADDTWQFLTKTPFCLSKQAPVETPPPQVIAHEQALTREILEDVTWQTRTLPSIQFNTIAATPNTFQATSINQLFDILTGANSVRGTE